MKLSFPTFRYSRAKAYMGIFMLFFPFFIVFSFVSAGIYFSARQAQRQELLNRSTQGVLESADRINLAIQEAYELTFNFINNDFIMRLLPSPGKTRAEEGIDAIQLVRNLNYLRRSISSDVNTITLLTADGPLFNDRGRYAFEEYFDVLHIRKSGNSDHWRDIARQGPSLLLLPVDTVRGTTVVPVAVSRQIGESHWVLLSHIPASFFQNVIEGGKVLSGQTVLGFDRDGSIIVNTTGHNFSQDELSELIARSYRRSHVVDEQFNLGSETAHLAMARCVEGIRIAVFTPESLINSALRYDSSNQMMLMFFGLAMILFFMLTIFCAHRMYKPVRNVIQFVSAFQERTGIQMGFSSFYGLQFTEVNKFHDKTNKALYENLNQALTAMVCGSAIYDNAYLETAFLDLTGFEDTGISCMALRIQFNDTYFKNYTHEERETLFKSMTLNLTGILSTYFPCYVVEIAPCNFLCFFQCDDKDEQLWQKVNSALESLELLFQQNACTISCGLSRAHNSRNFIYPSAMEAITALRLVKENRSIGFAVFREETVSYSPAYTSRERNALLSLIKNSDKERSLSYVDAIIAQNREAILYEPLLQKIALAIFDTGLEHLYAMQADRQVILDLINAYPPLYYPHNEMVHRLKMFLASCIGVIKPPVIGNLEKVLDFIARHYQGELYLEIIAKHFSMNQKYLSRWFKDKMAIGINEYINQYRINKAKELLTETDKNVADIGNAVGFENRTTFFRSFKKMEGISPNDYRKMFGETRRS